MSYPSCAFLEARPPLASLKEFIGALHRGGAKILAGTHTATQSVVPGFSVHDELRNLVDAGRSSYQAIRAATSDAAEFLNSADRWGTVKIGARADLILTTANPLEDVRNVSRRAGVMQASLKRLAASDESGPPPR